MAIGDVLEFNQFKVDLGNKIHNLATDTYKFGLINSTITPVVTAVAPHWGGTGTTDYSANECTPGGNYPSGGITATNVTYTESSGTVSLNMDKLVVALNAGNPTDARWFVMYNDTDVNKRCVAFIDLGSVRDLTIGLLEFRFNAVDGIGTLMTVS